MIFIRSTFIKREFAFCEKVIKSKFLCQLKNNKAKKFTIPKNVFMTILTYCLFF